MSVKILPGEWASVNDCWNTLEKISGVRRLSFNFADAIDTTAGFDIGGNLVLSGAGVISGFSALQAGSTLSAVLEGNVSASGTAVKVGNLTALSSGKIISFYNDALTTEKAYIDYNGSGFFNRLYANGFYGSGTNAGKVVGSVADGGAAIGVQIGNVNSLATTGAKIVSFYSDELNTEKAFIDKNGGPTFLGDITEKGNLKFQVVSRPIAPSAVTVGPVTAPVALTAACVGAVSPPTLLTAAHVTAVAAPTAPTAASVGAVTAPGAAIASTIPGVGQLSAGHYSYKLTFVTAYGETEAGTASNDVIVTNPVANGRILLIDLPVSADSRVTSKNLYRTAANGSTYKFVMTLGADVAEFLDNKPDLNLGSNAPSANTAVNGALSVGDYYYKVTYLTATGETEPGPANAVAATVTNAGEDGRITISGIPFSADSRVTGRQVYRTEAGGSDYYLVLTIPNNVGVVSATDNISDAVLVTNPPAPTVNDAVDGNLTVGNYDYKMTYVTAAGETEGGAPLAAPVAITDQYIDGQVNITAIPVSLDPRVTSKNLYRTEVGGVVFKKLATLAANATTYFDNIADASLGAACPATNTAVNGALELGNYDYVVTYVTAAGETDAGVACGNTAVPSGTTVDGKIQLTNIPDSADPRVTAKNVYRTKKTGAPGNYFFLTSLVPGQTSFLDNIPDASLPITTVPVTNTAGAGNINNGNHYYKVTFVTSNGESAASPASAVLTITDLTNDGQATVTFPTGGDPNVIARKLYRTEAGGSSYYLLATISNNTTATYLDNISDATLAMGVSLPTIDMSAGNIVGGAPNAADSVALKVGNTTTLAASGAKIASFYNDNFITEKSYIDKNGSTYADGSFYTEEGKLETNATNVGLQINSNEASDGSAVAVTVNNKVALTTAGDKLLSIQNNSIEKLSVDKDGTVALGGGLTVTGDLTEKGNIYFAPLAAPASAPIFDSFSAGGAVDAGDHYYKVTFITASGETLASVASAVITVANPDNTVNLKTIPVSGDSRVTQRKLYRTKAGATTYYLLDTIADNSTTTYIDIIADAALPVTVEPSVNTTSACVLGNSVDAATSKAIKIGNVTDLTTAGAKIVSFYKDNLITEKAYVDQAGKLGFNELLCTNTTSSVFKSSTMATGGTDVAHVLDTVNTLAAADKLLSVKNNGTEELYVSGSGGIYSADGVLECPTASTGIAINGNDNSDGSAVGVTINNKVSLTTVGDKLLSIKNATVEKVYLDKDGLLSLGESNKLSINPQETTPSACVAADPTAGGAVNDGTHSYKVTFVTPEGESDPSVKSNVINCGGGNNTVVLSGISIGSSRCTSRKIYRTVAGDAGNWKLVTTIANNTATTYTDNTADAGLGADAPAANTTTNVISTNISSTAARGLVIKSNSVYGSGNIVSFQNDGTEIAYLTAAGGWYITGTFSNGGNYSYTKYLQAYNSSVPLSITGQRPDSAVPEVLIGSHTTKYTVGSKLVSFCGNALTGANEKSYIDKDGLLSLGASSKLTINPQEQTAPALTVGTATAGGSVDDGSHTYKVTFVTPEGESDAGTASAAATTGGGNNTVPLSSIPTGTVRCTSRKIYRNKIADPATWYLLTTIANNTATTYSDTTADAGLGAAAPSVNTTSNVITSAVANSATAKAFTFNTAALSTAGSKILSLQNNAVEKLSVDYAGNVVGNSFNIAGALVATSSSLDTRVNLINGASTLTLKGYQADGATAVGIITDTNASYTTNGAKLLSIKNASVEKGYLDKDGGWYITGTFSNGGNYSYTRYVQSPNVAGNYLSLANQYANDTVGVVIGTRTPSVSVATKMVSFCGNAVSGTSEKGYLDKDGLLSLGAGNKISISPQEQTAPAITVGTATAGGAVDDGTHSYKITFVNPEGESDAGTVSANATTGGGNNTVPLTNIWIGSTRCTSRKIYRNKIADPATWYLLTTIANNTATTYSDTTADAGLGAAAPSVNTTSNVITSAVADSATAKSCILNTAALSTEGSKILSLQNNASEKAFIDKDGAIGVGGIGVLPVASANYRGCLWVVQGGAGVDDILYVCLKKGADGTYSWKQIATGA